MKGLAALLYPVPIGRCSGCLCANEVFVTGLILPNWFGDGIEPVAVTWGLHVDPPLFKKKKLKWN